MLRSLKAMSLATQIFCAATLWLLLAAYRYGGAVERAVALLFTVATALSLLARRVQQSTLYSQLDSVVAVLDVILLFCLAILAVRTRRWWLYAATALQTLTCLGHVAKLVDPRIAPIAYFMMLVSSSYPSLLLLTIGIWQHHREQARCLPGSSHEARLRTRK